MAIIPRPYQRLEPERNSRISNLIPPIPKIITPIQRLNHWLNPNKSITTIVMNTPIRKTAQNRNTCFELLALRTGSAWDTFGEPPVREMASLYHKSKKV
jgi:hypothetical protein